MVKHFENQTFSGLVRVDGQTYTDCRFQNAEVVYAGGPPPTYTRCGFEGSRLVFEGAADATIQYMRALAAAGPELQSAIRAMLPELIEPTTAAAAAND